MDPISLILSLACTGMCCLLAVFSIAGLLYVVLGRSAPEPERPPVHIRGLPAPQPEAARKSPETPAPAPAAKAPGPVAKADPAAQTIAVPSVEKPAPSAGSNAATHILKSDDEYDDADEMATVVAPPPGLRNVPSQPPPPPPIPPADKVPAPPDGSGPTERPATPPAPSGDVKPKPPLPPRSSGQTIIAFDDDDEDW